MAEDKVEDKIEYEEESVIPQIKKKEEEISKLLEREKENCEKIIEEAKKKASLIIEETKKKLPELREKRREDGIKQAKIDAEAIRTEGEQLIREIEQKASPNIPKVTKIVLSELIPD